MSPGGFRVRDRRWCQLKFEVSVEVYGVAKLSVKSLIDSASRFVSIDGELLLK